MSFVRSSNYGPSKFIFGLENELKNLIRLCEISKNYQGINVVRRKRYW